MSICKQSPRFNASKTLHEDLFLNHKMNFNYENLNLVHSDNQDDFASPKPLKKILGPNKTQGLSALKVPKSSFASTPKTFSSIDSIETNLLLSQDYGENAATTYLKLKYTT